MGRKKRRVRCICQNCNEEFEVIVSRLKHGRGKNCSPTCQYSSIKNQPKQKRVYLSCLNCSSVFWRYQSKLKNQNGSGKYCSRVCRDIHRIGPNHPQFKTGVAWNHHGPNWSAQRRKAKKRDGYSCVECLMTEQESIKKFGQLLHVHHKIPFRKFDSYREANRLRNLETLCATDHRRTEAVING